MIEVNGNMEAHMEMAIRSNEASELETHFKALWRAGEKKSIPTSSVLTGLGQILNRDLPANMVGYVACLDDMKPGELIAACCTAARECKFFPTPSELRELAGIPTAAQQERAAARRALQEVLEAIRNHGPELRPIPGAILTDKGEDGRLLDIPLRAPSTLPPLFPEQTFRAVRSLGWGESRAGLQLLSTHPAVFAMAGTVEYGAYGPTLARQAEEIEKRWFEAYREAGR